MSVNTSKTETIRQWAPILRGLFAGAGRLPIVAFDDNQTHTDDGATLKTLLGEPADDAALCARLRREIDRHVQRTGAAPRSVTVDGFGLFQIDPAGGTGRVAGKLALVTGGAQGFGLEIAEALAAEGARVALADINLEGARAAADRLNGRLGAGRALAVEINVGDAASVQAAVDRLLLAWGGLDLLVSNAGVLRAGGLDALSEADFDFVTRVNYKGYYLCVRAVAPVLARQHRACPGVWSDIIQINSKSGLEGSKRNFAYAGGKFGGIGLTQSFALELVDRGIKVNAICPGNFFDGPLWSDPTTGLFVQYLNTGKVPGATTIDDVRRFYEAKVPMGRGCEAPDVMRAIYYLVEQQYETGQALPVTGGQVMLR